MECQAGYEYYLTIIPRARVGYEMIDSQRGAQRRVGYNHLISNKRKWNNCFIKNNQEIFLDLTDFAVQERPEGNLMVAISRPWYNCSYTMAAKPIKSLELHYTMMQFLIMLIMPCTLSIPQSPNSLVAHFACFLFYILSQLT